MPDGPPGRSDTGVKITLHRCHIKKSPHEKSSEGRVNNAMKKSLLPLNVRPVFLPIKNPPTWQNRRLWRNLPCLSYGM